MPRACLGHCRSMVPCKRCKVKRACKAQAALQALCGRGVRAGHCAAHRCSFWPHGLCPEGRAARQGTTCGSGLWLFTACPLITSWNSCPKKAAAFSHMMMRGM